jgi:dCTP deaminase
MSLSLPARVQQPLISALAYQAEVFLHELDSITEVDYPTEACTIRDILGCVARYLSEELNTLAASQSPVDQPVMDRARYLGSLVQDLYAYLRYLRASDPGQTPPGLQQALSQLTDQYFPKQFGNPIVLVRPQWKYNLKCVLLTWELNDLLPLSVLDPDGNKFRDVEEVVPALWKQYGYKGDLPRQVAVLSFAGLDSRDALLYPLLAHELGHFIDFSYSPPLNLDDSLSARGHSSGGRERIGVCFRELLADLIATRMMGFAYFAALSKFLTTVGAWSQTAVESSGYPGICFRLWVCLQEVQPQVRRFIRAQRTSRGRQRITKFLSKYLSEWQSRLKKCSQRGGDPVAQAVFDALPDLKRLARKAVPKPALLTDQFFERIALLEQELPPSLPREKEGCFAELMSAAWAYQFVYGEGPQAKAHKLGKSVQEYMKTCRLVTKAIELIPFSRNHASDLKTRMRRRRRAGILSDAEIKAEIGSTGRDRLTVIPCLKDSVQGASLDVHLGNWFAVARRTHLSCVDPGAKEDVQQLMRVGMEEFFIQAGKTFLIHPGDLVLGTTLEFVSLPPDLMAFVEGKSRLGRLGLIVATATQVAPGFHGVITLELVNSGTVPLQLRPGMPIAQLVFQRLPAGTKHLYRGQFHCQIKPVVLPTLY